MAWSLHGHFSLEKHFGPLQWTSTPPSGPCACRDCSFLPPRGMGPGRGKKPCLKLVPNSHTACVLFPRFNLRSLSIRPRPPAGACTDSPVSGFKICHHQKTPNREIVRELTFQVDNSRGLWGAICAAQSSRVPHPWFRQRLVLTNKVTSSSVLTSQPSLACTRKYSMG